MNRRRSPPGAERRLARLEPDPRWREDRRRRPPGRSRPCARPPGRPRARPARRPRCGRRPRWPRPADPAGAGAERADAGHPRELRGGRSNRRRAGRCSAAARRPATDDAYDATRRTPTSTRPATRSRTRTSTTTRSTEEPAAGYAATPADGAAAPRRCRAAGLGPRPAHRGAGGRRLRRRWRLAAVQGARPARRHDRRRPGVWSTPPSSSSTLSAAPGSSRPCWSGVAAPPASPSPSTAGEAAIPLVLVLAAAVGLPLVPRRRRRRPAGGRTSASPCSASAGSAGSARSPR